MEILGIKSANSGFLLLSLGHFHSTYFQRQSEQGDKAVSVVVVVEITGGKGSQGFAVQGVWGGGSGFDDVAFVQFEFYFTGRILLCRFNECLRWPHAVG